MAPSPKSKNVGTGAEAKKSGLTWDKIIPLFFTVISLIISIAAYRNSFLTRQDALSKDKQEQQQVQAQKQQSEKQQAYQCYLLGKELWMVEEAYVQAPFKRKVLGLSDNMAQAVTVQQTILIGHELDLDVQPFLTSVYDAKANTFDKVKANATQEQEEGTNATATALATAIQAKFPPAAATAFQVGRDVGWLTFLDDLYYDNEHYLPYQAVRRKSLKLLNPSVSHSTMDDNSEDTSDTSITGPMEETAQRLNKQVATWGLDFEFGHTETRGFASDPNKFITTTMPYYNRSQEIHDFTAKIEQYLKPQ